MKKSEAIKQLEALEIPYLEDGQSMDATRRSMTEDTLAMYIRSRDMIVVHAPMDILQTLQAQGWDIMMRSASLRDFEPEDDAIVDMPAPTPTGVVVVKSGMGFTGEPSEMLVDVRATAQNYRELLSRPLVAGGGSNARIVLARALRRHVETACPELSRDQADEQIGLLFNAVLVNIRTSYAFQGYQSSEAYR